MTYRLSTATSPTGEMATVYGYFLATPALGPLLRDTSLVRFYVSLESVIAAGSSLLPSLSLAALASDNPVMVGARPAVVNEVKEGSTVASALAARPKLFPVLLTTVLARGEEVGRLRKMLQDLEAAYQEETYFRVGALKALAEPLLLAIVSCIVAVVILAVFLPLYGSLASLGT